MNKNLNLLHSAVPAPAVVCRPQERWWGEKNPLCLSDERNNATWGDNSLLLARGLAPCVPKGAQHPAVWALCSAEQNPGHVQAPIQASPNVVKHKGQAGMETAHTSVLCCSRLQYPHAIAVQTCIAEHWFLQVFTKNEQTVIPSFQDQDSMKNPNSVQHPCIAFLNNSYSISKYKRKQTGQACRPLERSGTATSCLVLSCLSSLSSVVSRLGLDRDSLRQWMLFVLSCPFKFLWVLILTAFESTHTREHFSFINSVVTRLPVLRHSLPPGFHITDM